MQLHVDEAFVMNCLKQCSCVSLSCLCQLWGASAPIRHHIMQYDLSSDQPPAQQCKCSVRLQPHNTMLLQDPLHAMGLALR